MEFFLKLLAANVIIVVCAWCGRRSPAMAGLVATMPLTSLIVMLWLYSDNPGNYGLMAEYADGALWGILPTILFFAVTLFCFRRQLPLSLALTAGFGVWLSGAFLHRYLLR